MKAPPQPALYQADITAQGQTFTCIVDNEYKIATGQSGNETLFFIKHPQGYWELNTADLPPELETNDCITFLESTQQKTIFEAFGRTYTYEEQEITPTPPVLPNQP